MAIYRFISEPITTCDSASGVTILIEMAQMNVQSIHDYGTMSIVDWTHDWFDPAHPNPILVPFCFTSVPEVMYNGAPESGAHGMNTINLESDNLTLTGTTRMADVIRMENTDPFEIVHIRIAYKDSGASTWTYVFTGVLDKNSYKAKIDSLADPDTWILSYTAKDRLELLKEANVGSFVANNIEHINMDVNAITTWYSFVGKAWSPHVGIVTSPIPYYDWNGAVTDAGRYKIHNAKIKLDSAQKPVWFTDIRAAIMYHSVTSIFEAFGHAIECDAPVNNGASWNDMVTTQYCFHNGTNLVPQGIDKLYVIGGLTGNGGAGDVYINACSFYDSLKLCNHSWFLKNSPYEVLKEFCTSLGVTCKVETTSDGLTYLSIREVGHYDSSLESTFYGLEDGFTDIEYSPYESNTTGVKVVSVVGSDVLRGDAGNKSTTIDCYFTSCNFIRADEGSLIDPANSKLMHQRVDDAFAALYVTPDTESGIRNQVPLHSYKNVNDMYSVCAIIPRRNAQVSTVQGNTLDMYAQYECYYTTEYGLTVNGDVSPRYTTNSGLVSSYPWNTWIELPAMALSHIYFSKFAESYDAVGVFRQAAKKINFKVHGLYEQIKPDQRLELSIAGEDRIGYVQTVKLNIQELETTIEMVII